MATLTEALRCTTVWTVREYHRRGSRVVKEEVLRRKNIQTNTGLTNYASAFQGSYSAPIYMVIGGTFGAIQNSGGLAVNATSVTLDKAIDIAGDTSLVLGVGTANQETVTWSARSGTGPYTYTIAACTKTHAQLDKCVRVPLVGDTMASVQAEVQFDSVNNLGQRMTSLGGFSPGVGQWTMQFFFNANQALVFFGLVGLADNLQIGLGSLHNHLALGYNHATGFDAEIDASLTLSN